MVRTGVLLVVTNSLISDFCNRGFFFQAGDGIRDFHVTGVQTCALPIWWQQLFSARPPAQRPKTFTAATGKDEGVNQSGHVDEEWGGSFWSRKLPFLFPKRDVYGTRCLSPYPFQKLPNSFLLIHCLSSRAPLLVLAWACWWPIKSNPRFAM